MQTIVYILGNAVGKWTKNNGMLIHSLNRLSNLSLSIYFILENDDIAYLKRKIKVNPRAEREK